MSRQATTAEMTIASVVIASPQALGSSSPSASRQAATMIAVLRPAACQAMSAIRTSMIVGGTVFNAESMATTKLLNTSLTGWMMFRFEIAQSFMPSALSAIPRLMDENGSRKLKPFSIR